jgi:cyclohexanecarboxylate-CoA ligase
MEHQAILPPERVRAMNKAGLWPNRTILDWLEEAAATRPDKAAFVDHNSMTGRRTTLTFRQLERLTRRIAVGLARRGVEAGDVVACQLPNWWETTALHLACVRLGAITNPLMPIFRGRELRFMLGLAEAKVFVVPRRFRDFDYPALAGEVRPDLPALKHVLTIGGDGADSFEAALLEPRWEEEADAKALLAARRPKPDDVVELIYTSGTTGEPKGVLHTSNTLLSDVVSYADRLGLTGEDVVLMASPLAHQTGFLYGLLMPIVLGAKAVYQDVWQPERAAQLIQDEGVTYTMASTPFLSDLTHTPALGKYDVGTLRIFLCAGAPIPRVLVEAATQKLGAAILSGWGMSENGALTVTRPDDPPEKVFGTDGAPLHGHEIRIVDPEGRPLPPGMEGELQARGPGSFVGYLKRPQLFGTDSEGWFSTGDLARMDEDGYVRIVGRSKDIIIRGGENVPVVEVEGLLYRHPAVQDAAIVAMPHERLGEQGCAFVTPKPGQALSMADMRAWLEKHGVAKNYWPERLEIVEAMPRTPSGKIQKFKLRETARTFSGA